ncbi:hypothetical protein MTR_6g055050 [Medicago truncatula]|uniref:Uncharacterized protein n=1 Tax=Medicago truncatula TaxID=3880 RepID=G7KLK9_MEDTR|nr:hypothetical protein MTR_6g055050 [Medicago truncatula]
MRIWLAWNLDAPQALELVVTMLKVRRGQIKLSESDDDFPSEGDKISQSPLMLMWPLEFEYLHNIQSSYASDL